MHRVRGDDDFFRGRHRRVRAWSKKLANHESIIEKLLQLRAELEAVAATGDASAAVVELDQSKVGRLSRMDAMQAQAIAQASAQRREVMLKKITAALVRIDKDAYGNCFSCDEPINEKRLEFDPTATLCIDCANKSEQR